MYSNYENIRVYVRRYFFAIKVKDMLDFENKKREPRLKSSQLDYITKKGEWIWKKDIKRNSN